MAIIVDLKTRLQKWRSLSSITFPLPPGLVIMKFGEELRSSVVSEYEFHYIDYDDLKRQLKKVKARRGLSLRDGGNHDHHNGTENVSELKGKAPLRHQQKQHQQKQQPQQPQQHLARWTEADEEQFILSLETELTKVFNKQQVESERIHRSMSLTRDEVREVIDRLRSLRVGEEPPDEEAFELLERDLCDVIAQVHELAKFVQLNYTGFAKIIKKHDKLTNWHLRPIFDSRLRAKPFFQENHDALVVELSRLYDSVRTRGVDRQGDSAAGGSQGSFIRNTTKYWVHPDNIVALKLVILKHLPVLVFNADKEFEREDSAVSSIYLDNPDTWDLYRGRLQKTEGAEAIRLRWYGGMGTDTVFVERKTHREDWTGEKSVKARFSIKEKNVNSYLSGELLPPAIMDKARRDGRKPRAAIDADERLAREVQYSILRRRYRPVCRTFYSRTAFQLPADARVRISLDENLTMIREDNDEAGGVPTRRCGDTWRRVDIGVDYPFSQLPERDVCRFPYAVLEVKLQTQAGQEAPQWVRDLISSHLVEAVPKFSKFIHGTATLFPDQIRLLPFWMPQMDVDIRKPVSHDFGFRRSNGGVLSATGTTSDEEDDEDDDEEDDDDDDDDEEEGGRGKGETRGQNQQITAAAGAIAAPSPPPPPSSHPPPSSPAVASGNDMATGSDGIDESSSRVNGIDIEDQTVEQPAQTADLGDGNYIYESDEDEDAPDETETLAEARRAGGLAYYRTLAAAARRRAVSSLQSTLSRIPFPSHLGSVIPRSERNSTLFGRDAEIVRTSAFRAPRGKKIYVPIRVEPKVYFANERTFLGWLEFSVYIGIIATTLLNFGGGGTGRRRRKASLATASAFTAVAVLCLLYASLVYLHRSQAIRTRRANAKYYEKWGPRLLGAALFSAVALNFWLELEVRGMVRAVLVEMI